MYMYTHMYLYKGLFLCLHMYMVGQFTVICLRGNMLISQCKLYQYNLHWVINILPHITPLEQPL